MQYDVSIGGAIVTCADKASADTLMECLASISLFQDPAVSVTECNRGGDPVVAEPPPKKSAKKKAAP